jgi:ribonuclease VapC
VIVDASAIVAVILREPGWERLVARLGTDEGKAVPATALAEAGLVLTARIGKGAHALLSRLLEEADLTIVPFAREHWRVAVDAYARFGKGRHPADLNFGDCLTYAVARLAEQPLLFVGDDFTKTDVPAA